MTKEQAKQIVRCLIGWNNPEIEYVGYDDYVVTAVDPSDNRRKTYNPQTGYFN